MSVPSIYFVCKQNDRCQLKETLHIVPNKTMLHLLFLSCMWNMDVTKRRACMQCARNGATFTWAEINEEPWILGKDHLLRVQKLSVILWESLEKNVEVNRCRGVLFCLWCKTY